MDFKPDLLIAWGRREEAERALSRILRNLMPGTVASLRSALNAQPNDETAASVMPKSPSQPVHISKQRILVAFSAHGQERFWIQFYARPDGSATFIAEVRHQTQQNKLSPTLRQITDASKNELQHGLDRLGHSWKLPALHATELPQGTKLHAVLQLHIDSTVGRCKALGLFEALANEQLVAQPRDKLLDAIDAGE